MEADDDTGWREVVLLVLSSRGALTPTCKCGGIWSLSLEMKPSRADNTNHALSAVLYSYQCTVIQLRRIDLLLGISVILEISVRTGSIANYLVELEALHSITFHHLLSTEI